MTLTELCLLVLTASTMVAFFAFARFALARKSVDRYWLERQMEKDRDRRDAEIAERGFE